MLASLRNPGKVTLILSKAYGTIKVVTFDILQKFRIRRQSFRTKCPKRKKKNEFCCFY